MREADALAERLGIAIGPDPDNRIAMTLSATHHKMSMLQDLEAGRALELDALSESLDAVRELAGMPTPMLDSVLAIARLRASKAAAGRQT
jgi:2-dehydropantoate 2-reductase